jgi:hypothetical protein
MLVSASCALGSEPGPLASTGEPGIANVRLNRDALEPYEKLEISFDLSGTWSNPFDPEQVAVDGIFRTPDGLTLTMPGFCFQDYQRVHHDKYEELKPAGKPVWKVRFAPTAAGTYRVRLRLTCAGKTVESPEQTFRCTAGGKQHGYLRVSKENSYYLQFDDGTPFFAIGENIATLGPMGTEHIDQWYTSFARAGGNFVRSWWCGGGTDLESWISKDPNVGLGRYKLDQAWRIDYLVEKAETLGIRLMCCLETQQYLRRDKWWPQFTYNAANGGPVTTPADYFVNPKADAFFQKRLRYIVARWSYSTAIFSWQFWNEVSACNDFAVPPAAAWHRRMAQYLRGIDPYDHVIQSNFGNLDGHAEIDGLPDMEVVSTNIYTRRDMGETAAWGTHLMTARYRKPFFLTEYGPGHYGHYAEEDPTGVMVHNGLWGAVVSGSAGTGMPWGWGDWIHRQDMYHYWKAVTDVVADVPFCHRQWKPVQVERFRFADQGKPPYYASTFLEGWPRNYSYTLGPSSPQATLAVSPEGEVDHPETFSAVLNSKQSHTLSVDYPADGTLVVHAPELSERGEPKLQVSIDGRPALDQALPRDTKYFWAYWKSYSVPVQAGRHAVRIANAGSGSLWTAYELQNYLRREGPDLEVRGLQTEDYVLLWLRNPQFIWVYQREGRQPEEQPEGQLALTGLADGRYSVQWRETMTGQVLGQSEVLVTAGRLPLPTPRITRSAVAKLVRMR